MKNIIWIALSFLFVFPTTVKAQSCGTTNIAEGKTVSVSGDQQYHPGMDAVDGNMATGWYVGADVSTITVDLGQSYNVCKITIYFTSNGRGKDYKAQISSDNTTFTDIFTRTNNSANTDELTVTGTGRYVRIATTLRVNNWSSLEMQELQIFNTTTPPVSPNWLTAGNANTTPGTDFLGTTDNKKLVIKTNNTTQMTILTDGFVGIGTEAKPNAEAKLGVNGAIYAKKMKVTQTGWADYVFNKDYKLPTLREIEEYIKKHGHLPGVPTTVEVTTNGTDLGDIQVVLLKKIEELTLYVIELNKQMEEQQKEITRLKATQKN